MTISRRAVLAGAGAFAGVGVFAIKRARAAEFAYKYANNLPATHPMNIRAFEAAERIKADTGGQFELQVFPNTSILPSVEGAFWYRSRPNGDDPNSTIFDIWSLGRYAPGREPRVTQEIYTNLEEFQGRNPILEQDFSNMIAVHKGTRSRGWKGARPNPVEEANISNIHRVLHQYLFGEEK